MVLEVEHLAVVEGLAHFGVPGATGGRLAGTHQAGGLVGTVMSVWVLVGARPVVPLGPPFLSVDLRVGRGAGVVTLHGV